MHRRIVFLDDYKGRVCCSLPYHHTSLNSCCSFAYSVGYKHQPFPSAGLISFLVCDMHSVCFLTCFYIHSVDSKQS